jgi:hypothetical protein
MKIPSKQSSVSFALNGIKTEQFAILKEIYNPKKEIDLSTQLQFKFDQVNKIVAVFIGFEFSQAKKVLIKLLVSCHFQITDESWNDFINIPNSKVIFPKTFLAHLAMITLGTARGVLFAKTEGTQYSKFIIPLVNVAEKVSEDAAFDLKIN